MHYTAVRLVSIQRGPRARSVGCREVGYGEVLRETATQTLKGRTISSNLVLTRSCYVHLACSSSIKVLEELVSAAIVYLFTRNNVALS